MLSDGLNDEFKDEVFAQDIPSHLNQLVELAILLDKRFDLHRHAHENSLDQCRYPSTTHSLSEASTETQTMQVGRVQITSAEHQRCIQEGLCLYCGGVGHFATTSPVKARARQ